MTTVTVEIDINTTPGRTFEVFTDLKKTSDIVHGIQKMEILTDGPIGQGTRFRETRVMMGKEATEVMEITEFQPGELYAHEAKSHGCHYVSTYRFEQVGEATRVTLTFEGRALTFLAKVMALALGWVMTGPMKKCIMRNAS